MPKLEYFLVAQSCSVDQSTGALSIFNVLNEEYFDKFPNVIPNLALICCWVCNPEEIIEGNEHLAKFLFKMPDGSAGKDFTGTFKVADRIQLLIYRIAFVPIEHCGEVRIDLHLDGEHQASHTIIVGQGEDQA